MTMELKHRRRFCAVCDEPQHKTPSGWICNNPGHGGAESLDKRPEKMKREMGWSHYLVSLFASHVRYWFHDYTNAICISCGTAEHKMIRVGCLFFCVNCFTRDFDYTKKTQDKDAVATYDRYKAKHFKQLESDGVIPIRKEGR